MGKKKGLKPPKTKCCVSSSKCGRCPLRMLKEGTLPEGYAVKKRRLVTVQADGTFKAVPKKAKIDMTPSKKAKKSGKKKYAAAA
ncbi:hypothetical protein GCM10011519_32270 [Marmoricola endophyticus]|uniref:Uncharacterized protein n=1 Tax=Marmoricola endophyticus TaxID=2040280 RepID=A0A917BU12_9ACTN|nr:hypothetical protein [Marmoricola endophyticus]GGF55871.1 hypothetical protein GCM10011519_32270 [Marmoricola endophyticus]